MDKRLCRPLAGEIGGLSFNGGLIAQRRMPSLPIVETLNIREYRTSCCLITGKHRLRKFRLQCCKEALHHGIIPTIGYPTHAWHQFGLGQRGPICRTRILAAPVAVMDQPWWHLPSLAGVLERIQHQFLRQGSLHGPADHAARKQVKHDRQVQPAFSSRNVRDIGHSFLSGCGRRKRPIQRIGGHRLIVATVGRSHAAAPLAGHQAALPHPPGHPFATTAHPLAAQLGMHPWAAIGAATAGEDRVNLRGQPRIRLLMLAWLLLFPHVVPAARNLHYPTDQRDRVVVRHGRDERVCLGHCGIREKMPSAFFRISL